MVQVQHVGIHAKQFTMRTALMKLSTLYTFLVITIEYNTYIMVVIIIHYLQLSQCSILKYKKRLIVKLKTQWSIVCNTSFLMLTLFNK